MTRRRKPPTGPRRGCRATTSRALIRSELWNPERHVDSSELPTSGEILKAVADPELDADEYNRERAERYARGEGLY